MSNIPLDTLNYKGHDIDILRLDKAYPEIQGNKYYKLKYNIAEAKAQNHTTLLTYGGAFSNHLHAVATAGAMYGFKTIGVVRGEDDPNNPTLIYARSKGMHLHFISRESYRDARINHTLQLTLKELFGNFYLLPEGGTNALAIKGCTEILSGLTKQYQFIFCPVGTGGTLAGLLTTPEINAYIIGISSLKTGIQLTQAVHLLAPNNNSNWHINTNYHMGGYAKFNPDLLSFIKQFNTKNNILLDPVYTGKMMFGVFDLIHKNKLGANSAMLCIHTGGLQGWDGWNYRFPEQKNV